MIPEHWKNSNSPVLFSALSDDEAMKKTQNLIEKTRVPTLNLMINEPRKYINYEKMIRIHQNQFF